MIEADSWLVLGTWFLGSSFWRRDQWLVSRSLNCGSWLLNLYASGMQQRLGNSVVGLAFPIKLGRQKMSNDTSKTANLKGQKESQQVQEMSNDISKSVIESEDNAKEIADESLQVLIFQRIWPLAGSGIWSWNLKS